MDPLAANREAVRASTRRTLYFAYLHILGVRTRRLDHDALGLHRHLLSHTAPDVPIGESTGQLHLRSAASTRFRLGHCRSSRQLSAGSARCRVTGSRPRRLRSGWQRPAHLGSRRSRARDDRAGPRRGPFNKSRAAKRLGMTRGRLYSRLRKYGFHSGDGDEHAVADLRRVAAHPCDEPLERGPRPGSSIHSAASAATSARGRGRLSAAQVDATRANHGSASALCTN
jgi:hypothetical protein